MAGNSTFKLFSTSGGIGFFDSPSEASLLLRLLLSKYFFSGFIHFEMLCGARKLGWSYFAQGGLKLWEGSLDLVKALRSEVQNGHLSFAGKQVLEVGRIFACLEGAAVVHFQDFNAEVLRSLTIPNVDVNLSKEFPCTASDEKNSDSGVELRFFAGDWAQIHQCLPHIHDNEKDLNCCSEECPVSSYDIILMAETIYSISAQQSLYELIKKCVRGPYGVVYMAAKSIILELVGNTAIPIYGVMDASLVVEVVDGSSNVRERSGIGIFGYLMESEDLSGCSTMEMQRGRTSPT
ncbi:hypothetical protein GH714_034083 [Hevea brasiliensis]|uniref:protein-histidine N-methyltransferase n=1 Tax=Hevea brasiliensis TaxID=3981 RepID=A0A6A6NKE4_HEVBR|nr:hypothetical protein GH714_034083 [Hevea brasiliensis]